MPKLGQSVNVSGGYNLPPNWDPKCEMTRYSFHLTPEQARLSTQSLNLPGRPTKHVPGHITVKKTVDKPKSSAKSPISDSENAADVSEPFPDLAPPQEPDTHLSQTKMPTRASKDQITKPKTVTTSHKCCWCSGLQCRYDSSHGAFQHHGVANDTRESVS